MESMQTQLLVGTVVGMGTNVKSGAPTGWLFCDGSAVSRTVYAELFTAIGVSSGEGDGQTTFNLPDYRGRFLRGVDDSSGHDPDADQRHAENVGGNIGDRVGSAQDSATALPASGTLAAGEAGNHTHTLKHLPKASSWYQIAGSHYAQWNSGAVPSSENGAHSHTVDGGGDHESRPVNVYMDYIIYYGTISDG